jgi:ubiquinone/menaquinone biosynthesis C-methylase UbiE
MLLRLIHHVASYAWIYDRIQRAVGVDKLYAKLQVRLNGDSAPARLLDVGGGTGTLKKICPPACQYICLDIEEEKLKGFRRKWPTGQAIWGDATCMPIASESLDAVICMMVAHHLSDDLLPKMLNEVRRILRPGGRFLLLDPVYDKKRLPGRILWRLDRGSFPRTPGILRPLVEQHFELIHRDQFSIYHSYFFAIGRKPLNAAV